MQHPRLTPDELEQLWHLERYHASASPLAAVPAVRRQAVLRGETMREAKRRWSRELLLENERDHEARRVWTGQVLPIRYDD
jgi:hypothetical protein